MSVSFRAPVLAEFGHEVICVDRDAKRLAMLREGRMPIYEPQLDRLVAANVAEGRLRFSGDLGGAVAGAGCHLHRRRHAGEPARRPRRSGNMFMRPAAEIAAALTGYAVIANKSTVPVGTGDEVERIIRTHNPSAMFDVVSNPEFLREGSAIGDFMRPDRVVVGADSARARDVDGRGVRAPGRDRRAADALRAPDGRESPNMPPTRFWR